MKIKDTFDKEHEDETCSTGRNDCIMKKKVLAILCLSVLFMLTLSPNHVLAYTGSSYTSNSSLAAKIDNLINGAVIFSNTNAKIKLGTNIGTYAQGKFYTWPGDTGGGYECYAYVQAAYRYLFGDNVKHGSAGTHSKLVSELNKLNNLNYDLLAYAGVGCGAYIRTTTHSSGDYDGNNGHSMIILGYDTNNITVLHAIGDNRTVQINTVSWSEFNKVRLSGAKRYISHIIQPNLTAWSIKPQNKATTLEFRDIAYPKTYKINSNGWYISGGLLLSDVALKSLNVKIIDEKGNAVSKMSSPLSLSGKIYSISSLDGTGNTDMGQKFSYISVTCTNAIFQASAKFFSSRRI